MKQNYNDPFGPVYEGKHAPEQIDFDGRLKIITWNLRHGEGIEKAIETLHEVDELSDADVLLLQEMDELGVERIAQELSYNYVFYPTLIRPRQGKLQGNAILTKWPIIEHGKIFLPKIVPQIMENRIAVKGTILVDGSEVDVYNVHLETIWLLPLRINRQADHLAGMIDPTRNSIVAGDFNSWYDMVINYLEDLFESLGLKRVSAGTGYTFETTGLRLTLDHIFTNQVSDYRSGVYRETDASDHYPVWADLLLSD